MTANTKSGINWTEIGEEQNFVIFSETHPSYRLRIDNFSIQKEVDILGKKVMQFTFECTDLLENDPILWNITSKRLLRMLKGFEPLIGKGVFVKRTGQGFDTKYYVEEIKSKT